MKLRAGIDILAGWADAVIASFTAATADPQPAAEWADGFVAGLSYAVTAQCANALFEQAGIQPGSITPPMPLNPHTGRPVLRPMNPGIDLDTEGE